MGSHSPQLTPSSALEYNAMNVKSRPNPIYFGYDVTEFMAWNTFHRVVVHRINSTPYHPQLSFSAVDESQVSSTFVFTLGTELIGIFASFRIESQLFCATAWLSSLMRNWFLIGFKIQVSQELETFLFFLQTLPSILVAREKIYQLIWHHV